MGNIWIIARREYKAFFSSFTAYLVAFIILLTVGGVIFASLYYSLNTFGQVPPPTVQSIIGPMMFVLVFACPAFSMRLISEEQRLGTLELLLTAPLRDWELVVGKWLGSFLFVATIVATTLIFPIFLNLVISPGIDQGPMITGYLGILLVSAAFLGLGVAISSLFSNQVAAYITTIAIIVFFWWIIGMFSQVLGAGSTLLQYLDLSGHFYDELFNGLINLSSVVYYASFTAFSLFLGSMIVETRRWR